MLMMLEFPIFTISLPSRKSFLAASGNGDNLCMTWITSALKLVDGWGLLILGSLVDSLGGSVDSTATQLLHCSETSPLHPGALEDDLGSYRNIGHVCSHIIQVRK